MFMNTCEPTVGPKQSLSAIACEICSANVMLSV